MVAIRGRRFFNVYNWGGVCTFASVGKMAGVDAELFGCMMMTNYSRKRSSMLGNRTKFAGRTMTVFRKGFYFVMMG